MKQTIIKEQRVCRQCKAKYEAQWLCVLGSKLLRGDGYCPVCAKKKYEEEEAKERMAKELAITTKRKNFRLNCGIPPKFMDEDFSTFIHKEGRSVFRNAFDTCFKYADKFPLDIAKTEFHSLILYSKNSWGVGKTHLACAIAHRLLDRWHGDTASCPVKFISEPDLFQKIQATFNYDQEERRFLPSESDIINGLIKVRLLIIDDIGKRKIQDSRFTQRTLFSIIDGRYNADRPIVITANLSPEGIRDFLGGVDNEASFDRLWGMAKGKAIPMEGKSFRREKG